MLEVGAELKRYPLVTFFALAYAVTWLAWIPLALRGPVNGDGLSYLHFVGSMGPLVAAMGSEKKWAGAAMRSPDNLCSDPERALGPVAYSGVFVQHWPVADGTGGDLRLVYEHADGHHSADVDVQRGPRQRPDRPSGF